MHSIICSSIHPFLHPFIHDFSTEDSEPLYDRPHIACHSDSDGPGGVGDRTSSVSPPLPPPPPHHLICDNNAPQLGGEDIYSEIAPPDSERLIKPSQVKTRRSAYAGG